MEYANGQRDIDIENQNSELANLMRNEYGALSPLSPECCIYRVSDRLRQVNEKAYTPQVVSIGPLHHGKESLKPMEEHKIRYLRAYTERTQKSLEHYIDIVKSRENELRRCYAEPLHHDTNALVKIVLTDAAFIIEVLLRYHVASFQDDSDRIFKKPWKLQDMSPDLRMLENQLPFFIVEALYCPDIIFPSEIISNKPSIVKLLHNFFKEPLHLEGTEETVDRISLYTSPDSKPKHFVDFLRMLYIPMEVSESGELETLSTPSVTELYRAGVKFRLGQSKNLFDIKFADGVLEIPKLTISDETDLTIRNLLAFEQCHCEGNNYINDYAVMMDRLVNTAKDVDLLVKCGVVENRLGDSSEAALLVNRLGDGATHETKEFYFASISIELDAHCRTLWHEWKANLRQNYFNTPWSIASVIAAVLLIALTIIQAVCSVISVINKD